MVPRLNRRLSCVAGKNCEGRGSCFFVVLIVSSVGTAFETLEDSLMLRSRLTSFEQKGDWNRRLKFTGMRKETGYESGKQLYRVYTIANSKLMMANSDWMASCVASSWRPLSASCRWFLFRTRRANRGFLFQTNTCSSADIRDHHDPYGNAESLGSHGAVEHGVLVVMDLDVVRGELGHAHRNRAPNDGQPGLGLRRPQGLVTSDQQAETKTWFTNQIIQMQSSCRAFTNVIKWSSHLYFCAIPVSLQLVNVYIRIRCLLKLIIRCRFTHRHGRGAQVTLRSKLRRKRKKT